MVTRELGRGRMTYVGACLDAGLMDRVAEWMIRVSGVDSPPLAPPDGVELCTRAGEGGGVCILMNHTAEPREVALPKPTKELLSGQRFDGALTLPPRGVGVVAVPS
jgi:beta-galactosidase